MSRALARLEASVAVVNAVYGAPERIETLAASSSLSQHIGEPTGPVQIARVDLGPVEDMLRSLADKIDEAGRPGAESDAFDALEAQISGIASRLDQALEVLHHDLALPLERRIGHGRERRAGRTRGIVRRDDDDRTPAHLGAERNDRARAPRPLAGARRGRVLRRHRRRHTRHSLELF